MKQLQNNFTTPEQSKRLLELGVPEDSADLFYRGISDGNGVFNNVGHRTPYIPEDGISVSRLKSYSSFLILPCWSVGRLIEIFAKCKMHGNENKTVPLQLYADEINGGLTEFLIDIYINYKDLDFSKLEE